MEYKDIGQEALDTEVPYDEKTLLRENADYLKLILKLKEVTVLAETDAKHPKDGSSIRESALPGKPAFCFITQQPAQDQIKIGFSAKEPALLEEHLSQNAYLAGEFPSKADALVF